MSTLSPPSNAWSPAQACPEPAPVPALPVSRLTGDVVLATDASELAGNAARVALAVAQRHGRSIQVVAAVDTRGVPLPPPIDVAVGLADDAAGPAVLAAQRDQARATLDAALETTVDWPVRVGVGEAATVIVREAHDAGAGLLVLGLRRHGPLGRAFRDETALHVTRRAECPVLAVVSSLCALPKRVVAAVDFSSASRAAARLARDVMAPGGTLTLAYVPLELPSEGDDGERHVHDLGVQAAFAELRAEIGAPNDGTIETQVLGVTSRRPIGDQLLEFAEATGADLLALGSRRYGPLERWLLGSVATDVIRDGRVSVLIVPPPADAADR